MTAQGRPQNVIKSLYLDPEVLEKHNLKINEKIQRMIKEEVRVETYFVDDADIVIAAIGTVARIAKTAIKTLRGRGVKVGLVRPITVFPFPYDTFKKVAERVNKILVVEMNLGQMVEDVKLSVCDKAKIRLYGRTGGMVPSYDEIAAEIERFVKEVD